MILEIDPVAPCLKFSGGSHFCYNFGKTYFFRGTFFSRVLIFFFFWFFGFILLGVLYGESIGFGFYGGDAVVLLLF